MAPLLQPPPLPQLVLYARWPLDGRRVAALFEEGTRRSKEAKCECVVCVCGAGGWVVGWGGGALERRLV